MKTRALSLLGCLALAHSSQASDLPPAIPTGPINYDNLTSPSFTENAPIVDFQADTELTQAPAPKTSPALIRESSSEQNLSLRLNLYTSDYQVRGMGFTNKFSRYGYSSVDASYTLPNRNLFGRGIQQRVSGELGHMWDDRGIGNRPLFNAGYALGKEIFPNLIAEFGYKLRYGGAEGYFAKHRDRVAHSLTQDLGLSLNFNDKQKGFFGGMELAYSFYGLTGWFWDTHAGYRMTDIMNSGNYGLDLELMVGISGSFGYWSGGADGIDAYRIRATALPYSHNGSFGRDSKWSLAPWIQVSWSGNNSRKIDRDLGGCPIEHFNISIGIDAGYSF